MNNEEKILALLEAMQSSIETMQGDIVSMKGNNTTLHGSIDAMQGSIDAMHGSIDAMHGDITSMQGDILTINHRLDRMEKRFDGVDERFDGVYGRLDKLEQEQSEMASAIKRIDRSVILIENEHGKKIGALFDGYQASLDRDKAIEPRVQYLERTTERHSLEILTLKKQNSAARGL